MSESESMARYANAGPPTRPEAREAPAAPVAGGSAALRAAGAERIAELVERGVLARHLRCPVCGSPRRRPAPASGTDNRYLRAIPLVAPILPPEILALLPAHRCEECSAAYCDPWLSRRVAADLYTRGFGQHNGGWEIFHASLTGADVATHAWWQEHTWARLRARAGPVLRYAELNCPFSGLLPYFRRRELGLHRYRRRARTAARELRSRRPRPVGLATLWRRLLEPRGARPARSPAAPDPELPSVRHLVVEPSAACWGANCISQGVSCQALAPEALGAQVVTLADVAREGLTFDVAVLTQLDHFFEPLRLLERFLDLARVVVVAGHHSNHFTRQHHFAFGPHTAAFLAARGWEAIDATAETVHPSKRSVNQCLFVSRRNRR